MLDHYYSSQFKNNCHKVFENKCVFCLIVEFKLFRSVCFSRNVPVSDRQQWPWLERHRKNQVCQGRREKPEVRWRRPELWSQLQLRLHHGLLHNDYQNGNGFTWAADVYFQPAYWWHHGEVQRKPVRLLLSLLHWQQQQPDARHTCLFCWQQAWIEIQIR